MTGYIGQEWLSNYRVTVAWNYQKDMRGEPRTHDISKERTMGWVLMVSASAFVLTEISMFIYGAITAVNAIL